MATIIVTMRQKRASLPKGVPSYAKPRGVVWSMDKWGFRTAAVPVFVKPIHHTI